MHIRQFLHRPSASLSYLLACPESRKALMIDPVLDDLTLYLGVLDEMKWQLESTLETHLHLDHTTAATALRQATGAKILVGDPQISNADRRIGDGEQLAIGTLTLKVIATPGHTLHCLSFYCDGRLFTGDCLLIGDCGNLCATGADAGRLYDSITRKLLCFSDETLLYPGHDQQGRQVSCIGDERRNNPLFVGVSRDEFIAQLANRARSLPAASVEIAVRNRNCGQPLSQKQAETTP